MTLIRTVIVIYCFNFVHFCCKYFWGGCDLCIKITEPAKVSISQSLTHFRLSDECDVGGGGPGGNLKLFVTSFNFHKRDSSFSTNTSFYTTLT
jgi:hypothetical protein